MRIKLRRNKDSCKICCLTKSSYPCNVILQVFFLVAASPTFPFSFYKQVPAAFCYVSEYSCDVLEARTRDVAFATYF